MDNIAAVKSRQTLWNQPSRLKRYAAKRDRERKREKKRERKRERWIVHIFETKLHCSSVKSG